MYLALHTLHVLYSTVSTKDWDCVVYVYSPRHVKEFWEAPELKTLYELCNVVEVPHQKFTTNLHMVQPMFLVDRYAYVFILLDDVLLKPDFNMISFVSIMQKNNLTSASLRIEGATDTNVNMMAFPESGTVGLKTNFVEIFAYVMTIPAYTALWQLLYPSINPYGWGYDLWYDCVAKKGNFNHSMGVISVYSATHQQGDVQADNSGWEAKHDAMIKQEKYFAEYHKILDLEECRVNLKDSVLGKLYD